MRPAVAVTSTSEENIETVKKRVSKNCRVISREVAELLVNIFLRQSRLADATVNILSASEHFIPFLTQNLVHNL